MKIFIKVIFYGKKSLKKKSSLWTFRCNHFVWFEWWILRKQTITQISELSGYSERQLHRWFEEYLDSYPQWEVQRREKVNLLIDGTWSPNKMCLVVYRGETVKTTLLYRLTNRKW